MLKDSQHFSITVVITFRVNNFGGGGEVAVFSLYGLLNWRRSHGLDEAHKSGSIVLGEIRWIVTGGLVKEHNQ
jgi:hypothetical protein